MTQKRALFIVNRHSRTGYADFSASVRVLEEQEFEVIEGLIDRPEEIAETIRAKARDIDLVILAGGDGTMNAAADVLVERKLPLGILPTGTGNDLARTLQIPTALADALAVIMGGHQRTIDVGCVNGKYFFNVASIGLSAELTRHHTVERKRRWWLFAYVLSVIDAYRTTRPFRALIRCNGRTLRLRAIQIAVGNGRHYGGGMTVTEDAAIDDQRLDIYCIKPQSFWQLLTLFPALRWGRLHNREAVAVLRGREIDVITRRPLPINTDGEVTTYTPAHFSVVPNAVTVFVPASYRAASEAIEHAAE